MVDKPRFNSEADPYFNGHPVGLEDSLKQKPEDLEYERLCFQAFLASKDGKDLLEQFKKRFHCMPLWTPMHPHAENLALFFEGFREALRGLEHSAKVHQARIQEQTS